MSYTKSTARQVYENFSNQLMSLAKSTEKIRIPILTYDHKNLIYQSLIVLLCSAIEEYHKNFIEDWFFKLKASNVPMEKIPLNARMYGLLYNTENYYKNLFYDRNKEKDILEKLANNKGLLKKYVDDAELFDMHWFAKSVWNNKKYPSTKNVSILYNRLGISNIFDVLARLKHKDYKMQLESFLSIRESITHEGAGAVTYTDVKNHICFINELIYLLDKELYKHCCTIAGSVYWPK